MNNGSGPLLLDTHCWLWVEGGLLERFSKPGLGALEEARRAHSILVSVISIWEIGMLESKGRIELHMPCEEWVRQALAGPGLTLVGLTPEVAIDSSRLPGVLHGDPSDRILVATARRLGARLLTHDRNLLDYGRRHHARILAA